MTDLFDSLLDLEENFYAEGRALGSADGEKAGRAEGRAFGLERGFQKFEEIGRLQGRCSVWLARTADTVQPSLSISNQRAQKNVATLSLLLTNPPFSNCEETVEEVEETLKRGRAKAKIVAKALGEKEPAGSQRGVIGDVEDLDQDKKTIKDL